MLNNSIYTLYGNDLNVGFYYVQIAMLNKNKKWKIDLQSCNSGKMQDACKKPEVILPLK